MAADFISGDSAFHTLVRSVAKKEGYSSNPEIKIKSGSELGDGFFATHSLVEIACDNKTLKVFMKTAPKDERTRHLVKEIFNREIHFYERVYPAFLQFQTDRNVQHPLNCAPKCYATASENLSENIILEDLKEQGYVMFDKQSPMNSELIMFVFRELARLHAVSYAMKDQEPALYKNVSANLNDLFGVVFQKANLGEAFQTFSEEAMQLFDSVEDVYTLDILRNLPEFCLDFMKNIDQCADEYSAITHGDPWVNNLMFQFKDTEQSVPLAVKIVDWQALRTNSPVFDLAHFFYAVAPKEAISNLDFYLKTYHEALSENIKEMGSDPEKVYPYSIFREHWRKFSRFGFLTSFMSIRVILSDKEEARNLAEALESGKSFGEALAFKPKNETLYSQRIRDVIEHFVCNKFI